jgi:hypothetical protein
MPNSIARRHIRKGYEGQSCACQSSAAMRAGPEGDDRSERSGPAEPRFRAWE